MGCYKGVWGACPLWLILLGFREIRHNIMVNESCLSELNILYYIHIELVQQKLWITSNWYEVLHILAWDMDHYAALDKAIREFSLSIFKNGWRVLNCKRYTLSTAYQNNSNTSVKLNHAIPTATHVTCTLTRSNPTETNCRYLQV